MTGPTGATDGQITVAGVGRLAEKVLAKAVALATTPMPLVDGHQFAPVARICDGLFMSGDGRLLIARTGEQWQVSEFAVTAGEVRVVGEASAYPSAQQALAAVRMQMEAGVE